MTDQTRPPAALAMGAICFRDRPFESIISAASASGFDGIGLTVGQCISALERGIAIEQLPARIASAGLRVAELELVRLCETGPTQHINSLVADLCCVLQPDRVHAAAFAGSPRGIEDEFGALCQQLAPTPVAVEFMPYNNVPDVHATMSLIGSVNQPNARIVLDVVHFFRSGSTLADLVTANIAPHVAVVQLSDVAIRPKGRGLADEARHLRTYPGRGGLPIAEFLREVGKVTLTLPPISVEPISDALETLPLQVVAEEIMFTTLSVLDSADCRYSDGAFRYTPSRQ